MDEERVQRGWRRIRQGMHRGAGEQTTTRSEAHVGVDVGIRHDLRERVQQGVVPHLEPLLHKFGEREVGGDNVLSRADRLNATFDAGCREREGRGVEARVLNDIDDLLQHSSGASVGLDDAGEVQHRAVEPMFLLMRGLVVVEMTKKARGVGWEVTRGPRERLKDGGLERAGRTGACTKSVQKVLCRFIGAGRSQLLHVVDEAA